MEMSKGHQRRVRIQGNPDDAVGYKVHIHDAETGEVITNVKSAIVYLDVKEVNRVELTYYKPDYTKDDLRQYNGIPIEHIVLDNPEIDVTAFEGMI